MDVDVVLKRFESPDETRVFEKGRLELVRIGGMTLARATYEPGWKWSLHVGPGVGAARCTVEHVGLVLSGTATVAFEDGRVIELTEGSLFSRPGGAARQLGRGRPAATCRSTFSARSSTRGDAPGARPDPGRRPGRRPRARGCRGPTRRRGSRRRRRPRRTRGGRA